MSTPVRVPGLVAEHGPQPHVQRRPDVLHRRVCGFGTDRLGEIEQARRGPGHGEDTTAQPSGPSRAEVGPGGQVTGCRKATLPHGLA